MALITCPECSKEYSEYAPQCPNCAFPTELLNKASISTPTVSKSVKKANTKVKRKRMRLPNGYGYIQNNKGRRKNPYIAYAPLTKNDYNNDGKPKARKCLGSFPTYNKAYEALSFWNSTHQVSTDGTLSFSQIWDKVWTKEIEKGVEKSKYGSYTAAFKKCKSLYDMPINKVYAEDMQKIIDDNIHFSHSTLTNITIVFNMIFNYADQNGMIDKNYAQYVKIGKPKDSEKGEPFTEKQIDILWENSDHEDVQIVLILMYSGMRISELKKCEINIKEGFFDGGLKTPAGKNRIVPIHSCIFDFVKDFDNKSFNPDSWRKNNFYPLMKELDIVESAVGTKHTPHDTRHTFSWLADKYKMDKISKHLIMGHRLGNDVEDNTYGHRTKQELKESIELIKI